jgi:excisionase family DNA binding protein
MLTHKDEQIIRELRMDFKFKWMEQIMKQFFMESLETFQLRLKYQSDETKPLLTIADIAKKFKVSKATIHNWLNRGIIQGVKVGKNRYFTEDEIADILHFLKSDR